jgi:hypothetical protein
MKQTALKSNPEKTRAWQQRSRKPLPKGKKTSEWEKVRRNLKPRFERAGITRCELAYALCMHDNYLGFAHAKKRRNLGPGELSVVILACQNCHGDIECMEEPMMQQIVMQTIERRERQP